MKDVKLCDLHLNSFQTNSTVYDGNWHICFILKTDIETIFIFSYFFLTSFNSFDKVETGHCTHWNIGKVFFVCSFVRFFFFLFSFFVTSVQE